MSRLAKLLLAWQLCIAALFCSGPLQAQDSGWPRVIRHLGGELTLKARPRRIVSTSPSITGILLAIEAPLLASAATTRSDLTDSKGFFSQWAAVADARDVKVLYGNLRFDIEALLSWQPDLVIVSATGADSVRQHQAELAAQGIPAIIVDYSNQSWQQLAAALGVATGLEEQAKAAVARFDAYAADVAASVNVPKQPVSVVGYNVAGSYSVGRPTSPQAQLLSALGFTVVGLPESMRSQVTRSSDYDFIARENLPAAITGERVFLLRGVARDVQAFLSDPVLANHRAVLDKAVYPLGLTSFRIDYYSGRQLLDEVAKHFRKQ